MRLERMATGVTGRCLPGATVCKRKPLVRAAAGGHFCGMDWQTRGRGSRVGYNGMALRRTCCRAACVS